MSSYAKDVKQNIEASTDSIIVFLEFHSAENVAFFKAILLVNYCIYIFFILHTYTHCLCLCANILRINRFVNPIHCCWKVNGFTINISDSFCK